MAGRQAPRRAGPGATPGTGGAAEFEWRLHAPQSNADLAHERLRGAIVAGQFEPGQRLTEVGIATLLGVSRTPVREAFLRLEVEGLLRTGLGGIEVVDPRGEAADIQLLREAVEGCAARLAAQRASGEEVARIVGLAALTGATGPADLGARAVLNEQFHLAVAVAAHAPRVERLIREYRSLFATPEQLRTMSPARTARLLREHIGIADAIADRAPDLAEQRMRGHLRRFKPPAAD
ncbi:MAG: GntR family transcriptional regulator [Janthinobacterium lividum]